MQSFIELFNESMPLLLQGLAPTMELAGIALVFAMFIGIFASLAGLSRFKILNILNGVFVSVIP